VTGGIPVEALERALLGEVGLFDAQLEALVLAPIDLVLQHEFEEVGMGELGLASVGQPVRQCVQDRREPQAFEHGLERAIDLHRDPPLDWVCG
jgi:hypothetical protein